MALSKTSFAELDGSAQEHTGADRDEFTCQWQLTSNTMNTSQYIEPFHLATPRYTMAPMTSCTFPASLYDHPPTTRALHCIN